MTSTPTSTTPTPTPSPPTPPTQADRLRALAGEQVARNRWSRDRLLPLHISNQVYAVLLAGQAGAVPRLTVSTTGPPRP
jgi:hypothetical protein